MAAARIGYEQVSSAADEFASLQEARAYIDAIRKRMGSLGADELIDALARLDRAYKEFPELLLKRADRHAREGGDPEASLADLLVLGSRFRGNDEEAIVTLLSRFRELRWADVEPVLRRLGQQGRTDTILRIISVIIGRVTFGEGSATAALGDLLKGLLANEKPLEINGAALAELVRWARRRLKGPLPGRHRPGRKEALLAVAERFRASWPAPAKPQSDCAWPSGRLSFDEFLLQWPCEIELPANLDDAAFIEEAYRAILLRRPQVVERDQCLRLLCEDGVSREWIIEDLLASEESHSLQRRLRVVYGGRVITEPATSGREGMPAVTWPSRPAG